MRSNYIFLLLLLCAGIYIVHTPRSLTLPEAQALQTFPARIGQWTVVRDTIFDEPTLKVLRPTDYLMRTYAGPNGGQLSIYIGYHNGGPSSGPIHSPRNCLPSAGWYLEDSKEIQIRAGGDTINLIRADFIKDGTAVTYYYWYQIRGKAITQDLSMKLAEFAGMLLHQRKDASFIRIGVTRPESGNGDGLVRDFLEHAYPSLKKHLPS